MEKSESIRELAVALNKAQATLQVAKKGSENPYFHSKYADLLSVWDACRGALTSNGLSISQIADTGLEGKAVLETILMHTSGEWIKGRLPLLPVKADPQAQGSAITYARRYSLSAIVGLCTEEDDDAEEAMDRAKIKTKSLVKEQEQKNSDAHWCSIHKTPFFMRGKMKAYAHPIKDESGITSGWCNEEQPPEAKLETDFTEEVEAKTPAPQEGSGKIGKEPTRVQNVTELKALMAKHKIGTREVYEILSIKSFMELVDLDQAWADIKAAKKIE